MTTEGISSVWQALAKAAQTREGLDFVWSRLADVNELQKAQQADVDKIKRGLVATADVALHALRQSAILEVRSNVAQLTSAINFALLNVGPDDAKRLRDFATYVFTSGMVTELKINSTSEKADDLVTRAQEAWEYVSDFKRMIADAVRKHLTDMSSTERSATVSTFRVLLEWDAEGPGWTVTVPALPGCVTQGKTRDEALQRAKEAITGHIAALSALGEEIPEDDGAEIVVERVEVATGARES